MFSMTLTTATPTVPTEYTGDKHLPACPFPVPHLNGTGRKELLAQYQGAMVGLDELTRTLGKCNLHERDFYPHPEGRSAYEDALATRRQVWALIDEISGYLTDHIKHYSAAS